VIIHIGAPNIEIFGSRTNILLIRLDKVGILIWNGSGVVHRFEILSQIIVNWSWENCQISHGFLGEFVKLRKAAINFVMSLCPSYRMEQLGTYGTEFNDILYLIIFRKSVEKTQVSLKSDKNNGYCT
jgi:hypothetical protein